jgi:autotransporter-associated beta strand protein
VAGSGLSNYTGGTFVDFGGNVLATGTQSAFGAGNVTVNLGGVLRLSSAGNLASGTTANVFTFSAGTGVLALEADFDPTSRIATASAGVVGVNVTGFSTALNLAAMGNGTMSLGSTGTGSYTAATLGAGAGATYRLGGGGGILTVSGTNLLTGANALRVGLPGFLGDGTVVLTSANNFTGGTTLVAGTLSIGSAGALGGGTLTINGGTIQPSGAAISLANATSIGGNFTIAGTQTLTLSGGMTLTGNRTITVTNTAGASITGDIAGDVVGRSLTKAGTGTLTLSGTNTYTGGTFVTAGTLVAAGTSQSLGVGNVTVGSGAVLRQSAFTNLGGGASVSVAAGAVLALAGNFPPSLTSNSAGTVAIDIPNFTQTLNLASMGNGQMFLGSTGSGSYNAGTLGAGSGSAYRLGGGGGTLTISQANVLTGFNSLIVGSTQTNGAGTVVLAANQDFQGNTTINAGSTLILNGNLTGPGMVFILPGATLGGNGTVNATVSVNGGGGVGPGNSPGSLTFANGVTFASGARYIWEQGAETTAGPGTDWDEIVLSAGNLSVNSSAIFQPTFLNGADPDGGSFWSSNRTWTNVVRLTGTATNSTGGGTFTIDNSPWQTFGFFTTVANGGGGVNLLWTATPVPEPAATLAVAAVLTAAGLAIARRRRTSPTGRR